MPSQKALQKNNAGVATSFRGLGKGFLSELSLVFGQVLGSGSGAPRVKMPVKFKLPKTGPIECGVA